MELSSIVTTEHVKKAMTFSSFYYDGCKSGFMDNITASPRAFRYIAKVEDAIRTRGQ